MLIPRETINCVSKPHVLLAAIRNANDDNTPHLSVLDYGDAGWGVIRRSGAEPSATEVLEINALVAGYSVSA